MQLSPLKLGSIELPVPVILAPMAGVTNYPFRKLCQEFGAPLTVSEMVTARPLVENNEKTLKIAKFGPDEKHRSIQLYGVDPEIMGRAVTRLVQADAVDHIDLNFGCPVKKVTSRGGGAVLPYRHRLYQKIIESVVANAEDVPVTVKFRMGIDDSHLTYLNAGKIAEKAGVKAVGLHARTAADFYSGAAKWEAITALKQHLNIPVLGNGDIFCAEHAVSMIEQTGCDGVIIGRGCLGRPWLFRDLNAVLSNQPCPKQPDLHEIVQIMLLHVKALIDWLGECQGIKQFRKHSCWYSKGFQASTYLRETLMKVNEYSELESILTSLTNEAFPAEIYETSRGKKGRQQKVVVPYGYLETPDSLEIPSKQAELDISGG